MCTVYTYSLNYLQNKNINLVKAVKQHIYLVNLIRENVSIQFNKLFIELNTRLNDFEFMVDNLIIVKKRKKKTEQKFNQNMSKNT